MPSLVDISPVVLEKIFFIHFQSMFAILLLLGTCIFIWKRAYPSFDKIKSLLPKNACAKFG